VIGRRLAFWVLVVLLLSGCGADITLEKIRRDLDRYPEYSVILQDMDSRGLFAKDYFHRYRMLFVKSARSAPGNPPDMGQKFTDWVKVDKETFERYQDALGMAILTKKPDGSVESVPQPPAFQYIGDPRFGKWQQDDSGSRVWAWIAASAVLSEVIDEIGDAFDRNNRRIRHEDWQDYRKSTSRGEPWYGRKNNQGKPQFGTQGRTTQKSNPGFFERQQARMAQKKETFAGKVESRMGRTPVTGKRTSPGGFSGRRSFRR
jgi:hypothetical protein